METLKGQLLIAMPAMGDERFAESVILLVEHGDDGAMGLKVNDPLPDLSVGDVLSQLELGKPEEIIKLPDEVRDRKVLNGGPVETGRGFVLHSRDYFRDGASISIADGVGLTATHEALRAIAYGPGPKKSLLALGYCGWAPGQLENELRANSWLTVPNSPDLLFTVPLDKRYERALALIGINRASLSGVAGSA